MMRWTLDLADYSWTATDALGCFYRVSRAYHYDVPTVWVCAWTETKGLRIGTSAFRNAADARHHMNNIAAMEQVDA